MKKNAGFMFWLCVTIGAALLFPSFAASLDKLGFVSTILIMLMYTCMGLTIDISVLRKGLAEWKVHLAVQIALFFVAPIISYVAFIIIKTLTGSVSAIALVFVGCLPTTITSCVLLTMRSKGNTGAAIYNAVFSQIIGVFITPMLLSLILRFEIGQVTSVGTVMLSLIQRMILPLIVGQLLRHFAHNFQRSIGKYASAFSFYAIFGILFMNLGTAISSGFLSERLKNLFPILLSTCLLYILMLFLIWILSTIAHFSVADRICIAITGSQKTLGMGVPLAAIFFAGNTEYIINVTFVIITYYISSIVFSVFIVDSLSRRALHNEQKQSTL